jgi:sec-independent protein translocase protein TatB
MNFLGVGPAELLVILVVALIFVGPERLPRLAADIARTIRELRKYTSSIAAEFTEVIEDIERETKDDRSQWKEIGEGLTDATKSVATALRDARADAEGKPTAGAATGVNGANAGASEVREAPEASAIEAQAVPASVESAAAPNGATPTKHEPAPADEAAR